MKGGHKKPRFALTGKKTDNKSRSERHEKRLAERLGVKRQPNSGAAPNVTLKGDLVGEDFMYQAKLTSSDQLTLKHGVLMELWKQASMAGKKPALVVTLEGGPKNCPRDWVCIPADIWRQIIDD